MLVTRAAGRQAAAGGVRAYTAEASPLPASSEAGPVSTRLTGPLSPDRGCTRSGRVSPIPQSWDSRVSPARQRRAPASTRLSAPDPLARAAMQKG